MTFSLPHALFWGAAALCVVAQLAILYSVFVGAPAARAAGQATGTAREGRTMAITWAVLPAVALVLTLGLTWQAVDSPETAGWRLVLPDARDEPTVMLPALPSNMPATIVPRVPMSAPEAVR